MANLEMSLNLEGIFGTKILVPRFWYQDLGTEILAPRSWYEDLGTTILVPGSWYQDLGTRIQVPTIFMEKVKPITTPPDKVFKLSG